MTAGCDIRHRVRTPAEHGRWTFRATECDIAEHVNNAAYWHPLEEELLLARTDEPAALDVEIEFRSPVQPGEKLVLAAGDQRWIVEPGAGVARVADRCRRRAGTSG